MKGDFRVGEWLVQPSLNSMSCADDKAQVEPKVMEVLVYLARHPGEFLPKERMIQAVWPDTFVTDDALSGAILDLRKAFGDDAKNPKFIQTIPKKGYRLIAPVSTEAETVSVRYRKQKRIGRGGMGEVYLFEDTLLKRKVAMKFLLANLEQDEMARKLLQREARSAASLDHPYICKIYDTGEWEGRTFIAMEYVEGETLKEKLASGPLPLAETLRIVVETSEALETAYEKGIVHRDIKPSNIMVTPQGHVKVTDFGLAKRLQPSKGQGQEWTATLTEDATVRGTLPYMSPEQLRAEAVDHRSDIFSLGVVLYEMLAGIHPFRKSEAMETASAILTEAPPKLKGELAGASPLLQHTVSKMLAKEPDRRYQLVHDVRTDLSELMTEPDEPPGVVGGGQVLPPSITKAGLALRLLPWVVAVMMTLATALILWKSSRSGDVPRPHVQFTIPILEEGGTPNVGGFPVALSPDGSYLAYLAGPFGQAQLYLRALDQYKSTLLADSDGADAPFFSPDAEWLGFFTKTALYKVRVSGGSPVKICDLEAALNRGASWGPDDSILFSERQQLWRVSAGGGTPEKVLDGGCRWPQLLPDGEHVLCSTSSEGYRPVIWSLATNERRILEVEGAGVRYVPSGHLLYGSSGTLLAVPFALSELEVVGSPEPVVENIITHPSYNLAYFAVSDNGTLAYVPGRYETALMEVDWKGQAVEMVREEADLLWPRFSPDGDRLSVHHRGGRGAAIKVYDLKRGGSITMGAGMNPIWAPDGKRITFEARDIYSRSADGIGEAELLLEERGRPLSWSPDGKTLVFQKRADEAGSDIWVYRLGGEAEPLLTSAFDESDASFSPNGDWLAYVSDESGRNEVYVLPYPELDRKWPVSSGGGMGPVWSSNGEEIFYRDPGGRELLVVTFQTQASMPIGKPRLLFQSSYRADGPDGRHMDLAPDGQHFVLTMSVGGRSVHVDLNWLEELKRLVPTE